MPAKISFMGKWSDSSPLYGYSRTDIKLLKSEKGLDKISRTLSRYDFNICFDRHRDYRNNLFHGIEDTTRYQGFVDCDKINIVYTNNVGTERVPLTAWVLMHRLSHSLVMGRHYRQYFDGFVKKTKDIIASYNIRQEYYTALGNEVKYLFYQIGKMRSCRQRNLVTPYEFFHEGFAQYIITGNFEFKPCPQSFKYYRGGIFNNGYAYSKEFEHTQYLVDDLENYLISIYQDMIECCFGSINGL